MVKKILIAENDPTTLRLLEMFFMNAGIEVASSPDGNNLLELVEEFKPDLILLDLVLPHLTSQDIFQALKSHPTTRALPVVVLPSVGKSTRSVMEIVHKQANGGYPLNISSC